jgi:hypothetical protein
VINDINEERMKGNGRISKTVWKRYGGFCNAGCDKEETIENLKRSPWLSGVDIIVSNAGSVFQSITDHSIEDWDKLYNIQ